MRIFFSVIAFVFGVIFTSNAQKMGEKELTVGLNVNTRHNFIAGFSSRYSTKINNRWMKSYNLEIVGIRHPKELRIPAASTTRSFVFGKINHLYSIRPDVAIEGILFEKDTYEGVRVNCIGAIGPSLGIVKPYFVEYQNDGGTVSYLQYNPDMDFNKILGNAGPIRGLGQSKLAAGGHLKASLLFEYSSLKNKLSSLETGFMVEQYGRKIQINPFVSSESTFITAFVILSFGKRI